MDISELKGKVVEVEQRLDDAIIDLVPYANALQPLFANIMNELRTCRRELENLRHEKWG